MRIPLDPDPGADEQYPQPGQLAGRRILLADEQPLSMQPLRLLLEHVGARCVSTDDGGRILELLQRAEDEGEAFDTLLLRQRRHSSNCLAMANYIRQQQTLRQPALLVLSAVGQRGEVMRFQQAGFDGYLRSPLLTSQLLGILQAVTRRHPGEPILTHHLMARAPDQRAPEPSFQGRVLLVEDVRVNQMVASQMPKKLGLEVELAEDGEQAVACWQQAEYDLIFMDCRMPNMDGYQATRLIRDRDQQGQHIPIIALTANATEDDRRRCLESGMDDIVTKPFHKSDLVQCLKQWLAPGAHA